MLVFFSNEKTVAKIDEVCLTTGLSPSEIIENAVLFYLKSPNILKILDGKSELSKIQIKNISKLKSVSRVVALMDFLEKMPDDDEMKNRYQKIISMRFGLGEYGPHTLEEIGKEFGVTRERIRQIITRLLLDPSRVSAQLFTDPEIEHDTENKPLSEDFINSAEMEVDSEIKNIAKAVSNLLSIRYEEIMGNRRTKDIAFARQITMYLIKQKLGVSYVKIAHFFNKDHTTVLHGIRLVEEKIKNDDIFSKQIESLGSKNIIGKTNLNNLENPKDQDIFEVVLVPKSESGLIKKMQNIPDSFFYKIRIEDLSLPKKIEQTLLSAQIRTIGGLVGKLQNNETKIDGIGLLEITEIQNTVGAYILGERREKKT